MNLSLLVPAEAAEKTQNAGNHLKVYINMSVVCFLAWSTGTVFLVPAEAGEETQKAGNRLKVYINICVVCVFLACSAGTTPATAQQKVTLTNIPGTWVISADITPTQAREKAIQQAKLEALRQAGVPERISESNILYKSDKKRDFQEIFKSFVTTSVSGEISEYKVTKEDKHTDAYGGLIYSVTLNCTVVIHNSKEDPSFNVEVTGIRETYQSPDQLSFDIKPFKDGFLTVFYLGDTTADKIYPNPIERPERLEGGKVYHFPRSKALEYEVSTKGSIEINYVVLLYTKQDIPFNKKLTTDNILQFLAGIDPGEKCVRNFTVTIKK